MTCKDCLHYEAHKHFFHSYDYEKDFDDYFNEKNVEFICPEFAEKSSWIHLPCKKGDVLIRNGIRCKVDHWNVIATAFTEDEKCRIFGLEEAEKALEDRRKEDEGKCQK